jgi:hypothetical protein
LDISVGFLNFVFAGLNALWDIIYAIFVPTYNVVIEFFVTIGSIIAKYFKPVFEKLSFGRRRRRVEDANIEFVGAALIKGIRIIGVIHATILKIFLSLCAFFLEIVLFLYFQLTGGALLIRLVNTISGLGCYLNPLYIQCTLQQIGQSFVSIVAGMLNTFVNLFNLIPGISIGRVPDNFVEVQCDQKLPGVTTEECLQCKRAYPGWEPSCSSTVSKRRILVSCDELPNNNWQESIYWDGDILNKGVPLNKTNYEACPIAKKILLSQNNKIYKEYDVQNDECLTVQINMKTVIKCPWDDLSYEPSKIRRRRNLLDTTPLRTPPKKEKKKTLVDDMEQPYTKITRGEYLKHYHNAHVQVNKKEETIFECNHENTSHLFDVMCGIQTVLMRDELHHQINKRSTAAISSLYHNNKKPAARRLAEQPVFYHLSTNNYLKNELIKLLDEEEEDEGGEEDEGRRDLQQQVKLVNITSATGSCIAGYTPCYGTDLCQLEESCSCPDPTRAFKSNDEEFFYNTYVMGCQSRNMATTFINSVIQCWSNNNKDDNSNPFIAIDSLVDAFDFNDTDKIYCAPLLGPNSFRLPKLHSFSIEKYIINTYCNETVGNSISECMCPGYDSGIYGYDAQWKLWSYYEYARTNNFIKSIKDSVFALINVFNVVNTIWSRFWGLFGIFPVEFVNLFDAHISDLRGWCLFFYSGSTFYVLGLIVFNVKLFISWFPVFFVILLDIIAMMLLLIATKYEENVTNAQNDFIMSLNGGKDKEEEEEEEDDEENKKND